MTLLFHNRPTKSKKSKIMLLVIREGQWPGQAGDAVSRHAAGAGLYCLLWGACRWLVLEQGASRSHLAACTRATAPVEIPPQL